MNKPSSRPEVVAQRLSSECSRIQISRGQMKHVILVSDLDDLAAKQQEASILTNAPTDMPVRMSNFNNVHEFNLVSAAHTLAATLSDKKNFPPGSVFVVTVDPHVGQNGQNGNNHTDKRVIARHEDGTVLIGPAHGYMRTGEFHGRGAIKDLYEINKERLIALGLCEENGDDVFDGLRRFGPAAAGVLHDVDLELLGDPLDSEILPKLSIPKGTISDIEPGYQNVRVEIPCGNFEYGQEIRVQLPNGKYVKATRRAGFEGKKGDIVAVNGSKKMITDEGHKSLYLAAVQERLQTKLEQGTGIRLAVGDVLKLS